MIEKENLLKDINSYTFLKKEKPRANKRNERPQELPEHVHLVKLPFVISEQSEITCLSQSGDTREEQIFARYEIEATHLTSQSHSTEPQQPEAIMVEEQEQNNGQEAILFPSQEKTSNYGVEQQCMMDQEEEELQCETQNHVETLNLKAENQNPPILETLESIKTDSLPVDEEYASQSKAREDVQQDTEQAPNVTEENQYFNYQESTENRNTEQLPAEVGCTVPLASQEDTEQGNEKLSNINEEAQDAHQSQDIQIEAQAQAQANEEDHHNDWHLAQMEEILAGSAEYVSILNQPQVDGAIHEEVEADEEPEEHHWQESQSESVSHILETNNEAETSIFSTHKENQELSNSIEKDQVLLTESRIQEEFNTQESRECSLQEEQSEAKSHLVESIHEVEDPNFKLLEGEVQKAADLTKENQIQEEAGTAKEPEESRLQEVQGEDMAHRSEANNQAEQPKESSIHKVQHESVTDIVEMTDEATASGLKVHQEEAQGHQEMVDLIKEGQIQEETDIAEESNENQLQEAQSGDASHNKSEADNEAEEPKESSIHGVQHTSITNNLEMTEEAETSDFKVHQEETQGHQEVVDLIKEDQIQEEADIVEESNQYQLQGAQDDDVSYRPEANNEVEKPQEFIVHEIQDEYVINDLEMTEKAETSGFKIHQEELQGHQEMAGPIEEYQIQEEVEATQNLKEFNSQEAQSENSYHNLDIINQAGTPKLITPQEEVQQETQETVNAIKEDEVASKEKIQDQTETIEQFTDFHIQEDQNKAESVSHIIESSREVYASSPNMLQEDSQEFVNRMKEDQIQEETNVAERYETQGEDVSHKSEINNEAEEPKESNIHEVQYESATNGLEMANEDETSGLKVHQEETEQYQEVTDHIKEDQIQEETGIAEGPEESQLQEAQSEDVVHKSDANNEIQILEVNALQEESLEAVNNIKGDQTQEETNIAQEFKEPGLQEIRDEDVSHNKSEANNEVDEPKGSSVHEIEHENVTDSLEMIDEAATSGFKVHQEEAQGYQEVVDLIKEGQIQEEAGIAEEPEESRLQEVQGEDMAHRSEANNQAEQPKESSIHEVQHESVTDIVEMADEVTASGLKVHQEEAQGHQEMVDLIKEDQIQEEANIAEKSNEHLLQKTQGEEAPHRPEINNEAETLGQSRLQEEVLEVVNFTKEAQSQLLEEVQETNQQIVEFVEKSTETISQEVQQETLQVMNLAEENRISLPQEKDGEMTSENVQVPNDLVQPEANQETVQSTNIVEENNDPQQIEVQGENEEPNLTSGTSHNAHEVMSIEAFNDLMGKL